MTVSGIISCCLPFLLATWLSIRVFFPALLVKDVPEPDEQSRLIALSRRSTVYLLLAPVAPLLALVLVSLTGAFSGEEKISDAPNPVIVLLCLIATSIVCLGLAYYVWQRIRVDLATLTIATRSTELSTSATDTVEVF